MSSQDLLEVQLKLDSLQQHIDDVETQAAALSDRLGTIAEQVTISNTNFGHFVNTELPRMLNGLDDLNAKLDKLAESRMEDKTSNALHSQKNKITLEMHDKRIVVLETAKSEQSKLNMKLAGMGAGAGAAFTALLEGLRIFIGS